MCGRLTLTAPAEALAALFDAALANDLPEGPRFNICPTQPVPVVTSEGGLRRLRPMRWGLVPPWYDRPTGGPLIINARSDGIATKPAFREAVRQRRCLVPASGFYEWQAGPNGTRLPWYFTRADGAPMALAAVWQHWERDGQALDSVATVTTDAGPGMAGVHDREPVILEPADWPLWLGEVGHGAAVLMRATAPGILAPPWRVDPKVNSNRAVGPDLILPLPDPPKAIPHLGST